MVRAITIDGSKLIVGAPLEFCIILYAAMLQRFPDDSAIGHFRWNVGDDVEARLAEVRKVAESEEFKQKGLSCKFGPPPVSIHDTEQRLDNFLTHCLPILPALFEQNRNMSVLKSKEVTDLMRAILAETAKGGAARPGAGNTGFFLMSHLASYLDQGLSGGGETTRERLRDDLADLRGADLVDRLVDILAQQSQQIERLTATVRLLDVFEEYRDVLLKADEPVFAEEADLATSFDLLASEYLPPTGGFHALEFTPYGAPYRWGGVDGNLTFTGYVDRRHGAKVHLELLFTADPENFLRAKLFDGNQAVPIEFAEGTNGSRVITAALPPSDNGGATRLTFRFPHARKLSADDDRLAAVAFHRLRVTAAVEKGTADKTARPAKAPARAKGARAK